MSEVIAANIVVMSSSLSFVTLSLLRNTVIDTSDVRMLLHYNFLPLIIVDP